jgi:glycosyltransferase involved in cell wall biosynthesis
MTTDLRIAFFPDSFHEANGVARTSRALVACASRRGVPFLCVHGGTHTGLQDEGSAVRLELARGPVSFPLEYDLRHDLLLWRHRRAVLDAVGRFRPDVIHITGPSDIGQLGLYVARRLSVPLVASWHTDLHDFAAWRLEQGLRFVPEAARRLLSCPVRRGALQSLLWFYRMPEVLLAPNLELMELLRKRTGRPTFLMRRGVDTCLFRPLRRVSDDGIFRFGFVGRLSHEKNIRLLPAIERALLASGHSRFRIVIVGGGRERGWLERHMTCAEFTGVLEGEELARAYAKMDLLLFPSETDTFGNVVQEALASGTPALVSSHGGPKYLIRPGVSGFIAASEAEFIHTAVKAVADRRCTDAMRAHARRQALGASWDAVLDEVLEAYQAAVSRQAVRQ